MIDKEMKDGSLRLMTPGEVHFHVSQWRDVFPKLLPPGLFKIQYKHTLRSFPWSL